MTKRRAVRRTIVALLGVLLLSTACSNSAPVRVAGTRCSEDIWARDDTHLLRCIDGRWKRVITKEAANKFWAAVAAKNKPAPAPAPTPKPPSALPLTLPTVPGPGWAAKTIAAGTRHTCAIASGKVLCWGQGIGGQLGNGSTPTSAGPSSAYPVEVAGITTAKSIAASDRATCAVLTNETLRCWGVNYNGVLGVGNEPGEEIYYQPLFTGDPNPGIAARPVDPGLTGVKQVALGVGFGCALRYNKTVVCWGDQGAGRLGNGRIAGGVLIDPVQVVGLSHAVSVTAGSAHACAQRDDGWIWCWGSNSSGQLGTNAPTTGYPNNQTGTPVPVKLWSNALIARTVEAAATSTCALDAYGRSYCWGDNTFGQLGLGQIVGGGVSPGYAPVAVGPFPAISDANRVSGGALHFCVRFRNGRVNCWGDNRARQLGSTVSVFSIQPQLVSLAGITDVVTGANHTCARRSDNLVACWGYEDSGQLGDGRYFATRAQPGWVLKAPGVLATF